MSGTRVTSELAEQEKYGLSPQNTPCRCLIRVKEGCEGRKLVLVQTRMPLNRSMVKFSSNKKPKPCSKHHQQQHAKPNEKA
ncbi:hypothetical protein MCOR02_001246 [Pyricularia oryzae]|uniref:Uncharacterized protein n=2 Tax=Pyricularia oryzae TaxID=318829 RepID=G4MY29_PYRO7|nr:uncharacterized protein MGG_15518 [Pyricularia oryzae 70-15]KAH9437590.1 hypothetical protein MCOR02_001246 [Pyricularia oryzae]EHA53557.1 hypothetical protein MGG_15518 [Pyricularia oryzae 70-15]KAI7908800.1 hypothetical protein M9X92_011988 [Pyricularia oryzae]KAI7911053.1 hypothetical protein M0657_011124 [Pyricularia oryzae]QBZ55203.1 hypothetical protein PoMZ_00097 [Pyricularia oryzae]